MPEHQQYHDESVVNPQTHHETGDVNVRGPLGFVAIVRVHFAKGFFFMSGGYEYPLLWMALTFAVFLKGGGPFSIDARIGREL